MKKYIKQIFILSLFAGVFASCDTEKEFDIPKVIDPFFKEDFQSVTNNTNVDLPGWTNFAEAGTWLWREKTFSGNGYAEFSAFGSGSAVNKVWLISPEIDMDSYPNEKISFAVAQHHLDVDSPTNGLEVLISNNYDGTNVLAATWTPVAANLPVKADAWYAFKKTILDASSYTGKIHIAFKFTGSGTNTTLDGAFQVDNLFIYNE